MKRLNDLFEQVPAGLTHEVLTHSSWTERRSESYERLAFLGDSVLSLAITSHLYPMLDSASYGAGRLTKIRAQTVSGASCCEVAERLGIPERLRTSAPPEFADGVEILVGTERVLASVIEAVIGACYLTFGYETTAAAVVEAFEPELENALEHPVDFKSALQERLAQRGELVIYRVRSEEGLPHQKTFEVVALVGGEELGVGAGRNKKIAEQAAAKQVLELLDSE